MNLFMKSILTFLGFLALITANGQTPDSTRIEVTTVTDTTEQTVDERKYLPDNEHRYLTNKFWRSQREERTLIKIGFLGIPFSWAHYEATVEQKILPAWSVGMSVLAYHRPSPEITTSQMGGAIFTRWYYRMNKRIRDGRSANNFVDQYIMVRSVFPVYEQFRILDSNFNASYFFQAYDPTLTLNWGGQLRIGRYGYFDFFTGLGKRLNSKERRLVPSLGMRIGVGL
jgi:hypothetical protein